MKVSVRVVVTLCSLLAVRASASPVPKSSCNGAQVYGLQNCQPLYSDGEVLNLEKQHNSLKLIERGESPGSSTSPKGQYFSNQGAKPFARSAEDGAEDTGSKAYFDHSGAAKAWRRAVDEGGDDTGSKAYFSNGNAAKPFKR